MGNNAQSPAAPARTYAGQDSEARVAQRRARFVEAGVRLFGTLGYHGTTMRTLTTEAGLNNRCFYESFETLEDLLVACYEQVIDDYRARMALALEAAPDDLEALLRASTTCFFQEMRNPHFARITQVEVLGVSPRVDALYVRTMRGFAASGIEMLARFGLAKGVTQRELEVIGFALTGAIATAGAMWVRSRYRDSIDTVVEATLKILLGTARQLVRRA